MALRSGAIVVLVGTEAALKLVSASWRLAVLSLPAWPLGEEFHSLAAALEIHLSPDRPLPQPQELFTSWLIRLAQAQGILPRVFLSTLRAQFGVGTRDLDARPSYELIAEVSRRTGIAYARIVRLTVQRHVEGVVNGLSSF